MSSKEYLNKNTEKVVFNEPKHFEEENEAPIDFAIPPKPFSKSLAFLVIPVKAISSLSISLLLNATVLGSIP